MFESACALEKLKGGKMGRKGKEWMEKKENRRAVTVFLFAILFRLMLYAASVCMMAVTGDYQNGITFSDFLEAWKRWDGSAYLRIAENGYRGYQEEGQFLDIVFFPLYPWLIRLVALLAGDYRLSALLVSLFGYGIGCVYFDKIVCMEFGEEEGENALCALAVFPFSFFFGAMMTEALFLAVSAGFLYYLRKHCLGRAALFGFFACLTKLQGMLLPLCVIAELLCSGHGIVLLRQKNWKGFREKILWPGIRCVPMVFGFFIYLWMNYCVEGNPFRFLYYQKNHWMHTLGPVWDTVSYIRYYAGENWYNATGMGLWIPQLILFFVYLIGMGYGLWKKMRPVYLVYLAAFFLLTYSSTWLISGGRYTLSALPLFMLAGKFLTEHKKIGKLVLSFSFALMMIYLVGYYQWKQIM